MAARSEDLCGAMGDLSVDDHLNQLGLNEDQRSRLKDIANDCESIFSWDIRQKTGICQNRLMNQVDKTREKFSNTYFADDEFNLSQFCSFLIITYELYTSGNYNKSLTEIQNAIKYMELCNISETEGYSKYLDAYNHIVQTTHAYIDVTLNIDSKMITNIKPANSLDEAQRAAICVVKAKVFMEYPPKGNEISLKYAEQARKFCSTEPEWISNWLKAKGRVRRFYNPCSKPYDDEIEAADLISTFKTLPIMFLPASRIYSEVGQFYKYRGMREESDKYYKLASDLMLELIEHEHDDDCIALLPSCLFEYVRYPKKYQSKPVIENLIQKLSNVKDNQLDRALGKYYMIEKDYEKAKMYLSRAMANGHFGSTLQLIKVECLLQPVEKFPLVQTLNMIYDTFPRPERRIAVLTQILLYFYFNENDPKELMHYLKLYMDQDIDNNFKIQQLILAYPLFRVNGCFNPKSFFDILLMRVKHIKTYHNWNAEEKETIENTFDRFEEMSKLNLYENQFVDHHKTVDCKQNYGNHSNQQYPYRTSYNDKNNESNWRKQPKCRPPSPINIGHQNDGHRINTSNKLNWRNQQDRFQNQSQHDDQGGINWRYRKDQSQNQSQLGQGGINWRNRQDKSQNQSQRARGVMNL